MSSNAQTFAVPGLSPLLYAPGTDPNNMVIPPATATPAPIAGVPAALQGLTDITGTVHLAAPDMRFDSIDGLLGSLTSYGDNSYLGQPPPQIAGPSWMDIGKFGLNALGGIGSMFMGMKQYGLAKDALTASKEQFQKNYAAQRQTLNTQLEDRQRARVASNPGAYESVGSYMDKNRIA